MNSPNRPDRDNRWRVPEYAWSSLEGAICNLTLLGCTVCKKNSNNERMDGAARKPSYNASNKSKSLTLKSFDTVWELYDMGGCMAAGSPVAVTWPNHRNSDILGLVVVGVLGRISSSLKRSGRQRQEKKSEQGGW